MESLFDCNQNQGRDPGPFGQQFTLVIKYIFPYCYSSRSLYLSSSQVKVCAHNAYSQEFVLSRDA